MGRGSNQVACKLTKFSLNSLNAGTWLLFRGFAGKGQREINDFLTRLLMENLQSPICSIQYISFGIWIEDRSTAIDCVTRAIIKTLARCMRPVRGRVNIALVWDSSVPNKKWPHGYFAMLTFERYQCLGDRRVERIHWV